MNTDKKLPEIAHLRGLGSPMFFSFNVEPKSKILICHAAIMGTFILPPHRPLSLCQVEDDPRLPHFVDYLKRNIIKNLAEGIDALESQIKSQKAELKQLEELMAATKKRQL